MNITSKIDAVTLFPRGAEITRLAKIELEEGEHEIILRDLPQGLVQNSLRVEGKADERLEIGAVDSRTVHIPIEVKRLEAANVPGFANRSKSWRMNCKRLTGAPKPRWPRKT